MTMEDWQATRLKRIKVNNKRRRVGKPLLCLTCEGENELLCGYCEGCSACCAAYSRPLRAPQGGDLNERQEATG